MKILLTGASGFLGQNIIKNIKKEFIPVYRTQKIDGGWWADLTKSECCKYLLNSTEPDVIVHAAADPNPKHPKEYLKFIDNHIHSLVNLLEYCKPKTKIIFISSILVYGDTYPHITPSNLYGACKLSCEDILSVYSKLKDLEYHIIRPCAIVGEGLTHGLLYDLKRKLKSNSKELELFGSEPGTCKPYVHVEDVCSVIEACIENAQESSIIDCFPSDSLTVKQVAEIFMNKLNIYKPIKWLGEKTIWKGDNRHINTSIRTINMVDLKYKTSREVIENVFKT